MPAFERTIARLSERFGLPRIDPAEPWLRAHRIIAARLVLALARERLIDATITSGALAIANGPSLPLLRVRALELHAPDVEIDRDPVLDDPARAWAALAPRLALADDAVRRVAIELADGVPRLALALWIAELRARDPASLLRLHDTPPPRDGEDLVAIGHPWHPMTKKRLGLSWSENLRYAPELLARAPIVALDVPRSLARISGDPLALLSPMFGTAAADHVRVPVHVAQLRRLPGLLPAEVWRAITIVPRAAVPARSLLSLRTVSLAPLPLHLKLALDVHTTSARRIVSPMSVANGPQISALLAAIARADPITARGFAVMPEPGALGLDPAAAGEAAGQLGAIVRDASALVDDDAIVCAALGEIDHDGNVVVDRLLAGWAGDAQAMFRDYVALLVPPALRLWTAHGLALELHLQNVLVRVAHGRAVGFVVRDLGGIRIHGPRLARAGHALALDPASFIATDDETSGAAKLAHSLVHAHLAAVIGVLADRCGLDEDWAWMQVRDAIDACLQAWSREPSLRDACAFDRAYLLAPRVPAKALLRMRIEDRSSAYRFVELANPIAAQGAGAPGSDKQ